MLSIKKETNAKFGDFFDQSMAKSRSIIISGEIDQQLTQRVLKQLIVLQELGDAPIRIYLNSQGGHVESADTIHDMIKFIIPEVIIIGTGWVASAGITILLAAKKHNRVAFPNTRFMIHQPLGGIKGPATDMEIEAKQIIKTLDRINQMISESTGQPLDKVKKDTDRNFWMDTKEAIDYGIISRVITNEKNLL